MPSLQFPGAPPCLMGIRDDQTLDFARSGCRDIDIVCAMARGASGAICPRPWGRRAGRITRIPRRPAKVKVRQKRYYCGDEA